MAFLYCMICNEPLLEVAGLIKTFDLRFDRKLDRAKELHVSESPGCSTILEEK